MTYAHMPQYRDHRTTGLSSIMWVSEDQVQEKALNSPEQSCWLVSTAAMTEQMNTQIQVSSDQDTGKRQAGNINQVDDLAGMQYFSRVYLHSKHTIACLPIH